MVLIVGSFFGFLVGVLEMVLGVKERCDENKVVSKKNLNYVYLESLLSSFVNCISK